jgi:hypothetical protein
MVSKTTNAGSTLPRISSDTTAPPPIVDENIDPSVNASIIVRTSHVPISDQRLVLLSIDNQLDEDKTAWKEKHVDEPNSAREEFFVRCIGETGDSLRQQLASVTIPTDEAEVERLVDAFQDRMFSTKPSPPGREDEENDEESLSSFDDGEEEIEFDDAEILDQEAHDQAKQLRSQARDVSARVISMREETTGRALDMTRRNVSELISVHGLADIAGDGPNGTSAQTEEAAVKRDVLNPLHIALNTLATSLQTVDSSLADKVESMKETLGTIDASVEKYQRMSQGDDSALSQTEKALFASDEPRETIVESVEEPESPMNPEKKLAHLLAGIF